MPEYSGVPEIVEGIWITGEKGDVWRVIDILKYGEPIKVLYVTPSEKTMYRHNIVDNDLNFELDSHGVVVKEISSEFYQILSSNPEDPRILILCDWSGNPVESILISQFKAQLVRKDRTISNQTRELARYQKLLKEKLEKINILESRVRM